MRIILTLSLLLISGTAAHIQAQSTQLTREDSVRFKAYEDTLNLLSDSLFYSNREIVRKQYSARIIVALKKALLSEHSFLYPFSGLNAISVVRPEDDAFRIFTWQLGFDNSTFRYFGVIQMNSAEPLLYPLVDYSVLMDDVSRLVTDNERWVGALYYDVKKVSKGRDTYYILFGYDGNNVMSTKKIAEVLWFNEDGELRMGAPIFEVPGEDVPLFRFVLEFRKEVTASLRYDDEQEMILFDHLVPADAKSEGLYFNYVPDGSYSGYRWKKGKWEYVDKVFDFKLEDGDFPDGY